jgi:hypothetical protein
MARTSLLTAGTRQRPPGPVFLEHWHETSFDWLTWSGGSLTNLGVQYNSKHIAAYLHVLRKHAIAWCDGAKVLCRPKPGRIAVMFRLPKCLCPKDLEKIPFLLDKVAGG